MSVIGLNFPSREERSGVITMPLDFPNSPTTGDLFNGAGVTWRWDGVKWTSVLSSGGPFLPLSGGTMAGSIRGMTNQSLGAGGSFQAYTFFSSAISGVRSGGDGFLSVIQTTADTVDMGPGGLCGQYINLISGGTGTAGNRIGQYIDTYFSGSTLDGARGYPSQYAGQWIYAHGSGNAGGTALGASRGQLWGGLSSATLQSGATNWSYCISHEFNVGVSTGASAAFVQGVKIAIQNHNQVNDPGRDSLLGFSRVALSDEPFFNGIMIGMVDGYWPIRPTGTLLGTQATVLATPPPYTAAYGVDFNAVTFSQAAFRSTNFLVNGTGHATANGIDFSSRYATGQTDFSKHIALYGNAAGINITSDSSTNYTAAGAHLFFVGATRIGYMNTAGLTIDSAIAAGSTITAAGGTLSNGLHFGGAVAPGGPTDLSRHIELYTGGYAGFSVTSNKLNYVISISGGIHSFYVGGVLYATIDQASGITSTTGIRINGSGGPTWTNGSAVPSAVAPIGSLYSRAAGAVGATLYVSRGGGTWNPVAGV